ncbi:unnamed protein product [Phaedon cochleariae]|uniref:Gustatory receptor n=1 Tax=Phaedon cochleariae TaxID=80249 RepID=A0A9P0DUF4_PHACE|nr:unnamed protein product [Phaedon cochleariae]
MSAQESIKCLRYISKICSILGIITPRANTWIYKVYSLTVLSIVFINAIIALKERTSPLFTTYNVIIKAVDQIANGFLTLAVSFATISNVFVYPSKLEEILDSLLKFDVDFDNHLQVMRFIFWSVLIGLNAIIMMMLALDSWFWTDAVSLTIYKYYFVRNVQYYQLTLFIFLIFWMAMEVYCSILAVFPTCANTWRYKMYSSTIISFISINAIIAYKEKTSPLFTTYNVVIRAADLIANGFLTLAVPYAAISTVFVYPSKLKEILDLLLKFDVNIGNHLQVMRSTFWSILICLNASIMLVLALDSWMWIEAVSLTMYKYYFVRNVQYYQLTVFIFLIFWMAMEVYCRFFMLNRFLERLSQRNQKNHLILLYPEIAKVRRLHNQLSFKERTSPLFPTYHVIIKAAEQMANGFLTLAASSATISNVFVSPSKLQEILDLLLKFDIDIGNHLQCDPFKIIEYTNKVSYGINNMFDFTKPTMFVSVNYILRIGIFLGITPPPNKSKLHNMEAKRTKDICQSIVVNNLEMNDVLRDEMIQLADQVTRRQPQLTASSFFAIDFTILGFMLANITSYIIVAVQVEVVILAAVGDFVSEEAKTTKDICQAIIVDLDTNDVLRDELIELAQQVARRNPQLTASTFFGIDFTILGFMLTNITTYIIVAIQFIKGSNTS